MKLVAIITFWLSGLFCAFNGVMAFILMFWGESWDVEDDKYFILFIVLGYLLERDGLIFKENAGENTETGRN